jgi:hypothetical protein
VRDSDFIKATPENIWNYRQNHPELVIEDLRNTNLFSEEQLFLVRQSMMARGINKWLKVRRDLIQYKIAIKKSFPKLQNSINYLKKNLTECFVTFNQVESGERTITQFNRYKDIQSEYKQKVIQLKTLIRIRKDLKNLCMTERWQVWEGQSLEGMTDKKYKELIFLNK